MHLLMALIQYSTVSNLLPVLHLYLRCPIKWDGSVYILLQFLQEKLSSLIKKRIFINS